jgi:hypothetical protein
MSDVRFELRNEKPNDHAVYIDGRFWKVFYAKRNQGEAQIRALCDRKTRETGKTWTYSPFAG